MKLLGREVILQIRVEIDSYDNELGYTDEDYLVEYYEKDLWELVRKHGKDVRQSLEDIRIIVQVTDQEPDPNDHTNFIIHRQKHDSRVFTMEEFVQLYINNFQNLE